MGVSLEVYRCRIGCFRPRLKCSSLSEREPPNNVGFGFKSHLPVLLLGILLLIAGIEPNPGPDHKCKFCQLSFPTASKYCNHLKVHTSMKNFVITCSFEGCESQLTNVASFRTHIFKHHPAHDLEEHHAASVHHAIKCPITACLERMLSQKMFMKHMVDSHLSKDESFECIYDGCHTQLRCVSQFRTHMNRWHKSSELSSDTVSPNFIFLDDSENVNDAADGNYPDEDSAMPCNVPDQDPYPDYIIKGEVARFYLRLEAEHLLPTSTVQAISEEITILTELIHHRLKRVLRQELEKVIDDAVSVNVVLDNTFCHDTVFNVHHKHEDLEFLGSNHMRMQYWQKTFPFVKPQPVLLHPDSGKKSYAQHVPVKETLSVLLKDKRVKQLVLQSFDPSPNLSPEVLADFTDGSAFKTHVQSQHAGQRKCLQLVVFQDGMEFNAFGSSSGQYKPNPFYYTLGNLPPEYRTKLDLIQLCFLILDKDLKQSQEEELKDLDKLKIAMDPLLNELADLKSNGIEFNGEKLPVCLLFLVGDSLGQHVFGGFVRNFSAQFWCRFCPMSKAEFLEEPYETKSLRTVAEYDECVRKAKLKWIQVKKTSLNAKKKANTLAARRAEKVCKRITAPAKKTSMKEIISKSAYQKLVGINFRGVKYRPSPFNSARLGFHVIASQPPCIAHDLFEGAVKKILAAILKYFIETKEWFDLVCLNRRIKSFKCKGADALDAPKPLKNLDCLSGSACENWTMLRLLPFIIGDLIKDEQDPMWQLYLLLKEIVEYVCAPKITLNQVSYLQHLIRSFLSSIKTLLPSCLIPKLHFLCHYPALILLFGPLIRLFTLRYESKHMFFKQVARACKNYINITYTLAKKYMCRFAYDHISDILPPDVKYSVSSSLPLNISELKAVLSENLNYEDFEELKKVNIRGINYTQEQYLLVDCDDSCDLIVALIYKILIQKSSNKIFFLVNERQSEKSGSGYYIVEKSLGMYRLKSLDQFSDYYPLSSYCVDGKDCLSLKHSNTAMSF